MHFVNPSPGPHDDSTICLPAIIVELAHPDRDDGSEQDCILTVFSRGAGVAGRTAPHDEVRMLPGSWHWPEIV